MNLYSEIQNLIFTFYYIKSTIKFLLKPHLSIITRNIHNSITIQARPIKINIQEL